MFFSLNCCCQMIRTEEWRCSKNNNINTCINYLLISIKSNKTIFNRNFLSFFF